MFCTNCGTKVDDNVNFCYKCGASTNNNYKEVDFLKENNENFNDNYSLYENMDKYDRKKKSFLKNNIFIKQLIISIILSLLCGIGGTLCTYTIILKDDSLSVMEYIVVRDLTEKAKKQAETVLEKKYIKSDEFKDDTKSRANYMLNISTDRSVGYYLEDLLKRTLFKSGIYSGVMTFIVYWFYMLNNKKTSVINKYNLINNIKNVQNDINFDNVKQNNNESIVTTKFINSVLKNLVEESNFSKLIDKFEKKFNISREKIRYDKIIFTTIMALLIIISNKFNVLSIKDFNIYFDFGYIILIFSGIIAGPVVGSILGIILVIYDFSVGVFELNKFYFYNIIVNVSFFALIGAISRAIYLFVKFKLLKNTNRNYVYLIFIMIPIWIIFLFKVVNSLILGLLSIIFLTLFIVIFIKINDEYIRFKEKINILSLMITCLILGIIFSFKFLTLKLLDIGYYNFMVVIESILYTSIMSIIVILGIYLSRFILEKIEKIYGNKEGAEKYL